MSAAPARRVARSVRPAPVSRPALRSGALDCGHVFVDEGEAAEVPCRQCAGLPRTRGEEDLWDVLAAVVARPPEMATAEDDGRVILRVGRIVPDEEGRARAPSRGSRLRARGTDELVECSLCAGRPRGSFCPRCGGRGTVSRWGGPVIETVRRTWDVRPPVRALGELLEDLGFMRSGAVAEDARDEDLARCAAEWSRESRPLVRGKLAGVLARAGWFPRPPTAEEAAAKAAEARAAAELLARTVTVLRVVEDCVIRVGRIVP